MFNFGITWTIVSLDRNKLGICKSHGNGVSEETGFIKIERSPGLLTL